MPIMPSHALAHASFHQNFARATTTTSSASTTSTTSSSTTKGITSSSNIMLTHDAIIWISCFATLATIAFVVVVLLLCTGVFDKKKGTHEYGGVLDDRNMYQTWNPDAPLSDEAFEGGIADLRDRNIKDENIAMTALTGAAGPIAGSPLNTPPRAQSPMLVPQQGFLNVVDEDGGMPGSPGRRRNVKRPRPQTRYYTSGWRASVWGRAVGNRISLMGQNNGEH